MQVHVHGSELYESLETLEQSLTGFNAYLNEAPIPAVLSPDLHTFSTVFLDAALLC